VKLSPPPLDLAEGTTISARTLTVEIPPRPGEQAPPLSAPISLSPAPTRALGGLAVAVLIVAVALYSIDRSGTARVFLEVFAVLAAAAVGIRLGENKAAKETAAQLGAERV
jgi:hypothetical protein